MQALDRAKRVQAALTRLVERRERLVQRAHAEFRLDLIAAIDQVDEETLGLVQRGLAMDRGEQSLQYAVQIAIDERNEARRISTRRSGGTGSADPHEAETESPPPLPSTVELEGDEDDLSGLDTPLPRPPAVPFGDAFERLAQPGRAGAAPDGYRYPEPGEPAVELPDGTIVAAPS